MYLISQVLNAWYFDNGFGQTQTTQAQNVLTFFVLLNSIIPLSLVVSMELAVLFQALFMMWDDDMRDSVKGGMSVMTSGLNSELGLIEYVLCDKTGTLTQNKMVFKHCSTVSPKTLGPKSLAQYDTLCKLCWATGPATLIPIPQNLNHANPRGE